ncbi:bacteriohopanetetrol glucosamine biosynthesis glycosyltransferase HpnI [Acidocella sp.]|uniref:bacteriohopanetetrol glucosamine biosynthesis glycosyltransferase HpnI n=1 Tax=Acidocella sp. TaxID=50710 RepID=UPI0026230068|nr:bacteriohopanetetrol glucosamine biosynthesis glycosyltransferase HpnI [Acidocella sp.]
MLLPAFLAAGAAGIGMGQMAAGAWLTRRFTAAPRPVPATRPPVTLLKPLCGLEPGLEAALETAFTLAYPTCQLVFGVQDRTDPVIPLIERLRARHPTRDVALVIDETLHGANRKVANLLNMLPAAKHDVLVMSDADIFLPPDFLDHVVAALEAPGAGLATTLYTGLEASQTPAGLAGAAQLNYTFLPGVVLARALGRQDGLGATLALTRAMLAEIGGLEAVANHLADDQVLGRLVQAKGRQVVLARTVPATIVPEARLGPLFTHELRWARTIRALVPGAYAASVLQLPLFWAALAVALSGLAPWALVLFGLCLTTRLATADLIRQALGLENPTPWAVFLLREALSVAIYVASFAGNHVAWRGQSLRADHGALTLN